MKKKQKTEKDIEKKNEEKREEKEKQTSFLSLIEILVMCVWNVNC